MVEAEYQEDSLWPYEFDTIGSYLVTDLDLEVGLFLGWYLTPDFSGEPVKDLTGYSEDITLYGKTDYTDVSTIGELLAFAGMPERQTLGFTASFKGLVYYISPDFGFYMLTDGTGFLMVYSELTMELGQEYEVTGSYTLYKYNPYDYEPPYWPMMTAVQTITPLGNVNGFLAPSPINMDFATLESVAMDDFSFNGQPITISGELLYYPAESQFVLIENALSPSPVIIYINGGINQTLYDYLIDHQYEVIQFTGIILNVDYLDSEVTGINFVVTSYLIVASSPS
ncbi:MAG: hypothetical protein K9L64_06595 [Candidatus Izimaplasma sp.]|nr:hypothetical protein [Candidatus Izimaplasma bacterium]